MDVFTQRKRDRVKALISSMKGPKSDFCAVIVEGRRVPKMTMLDQGDDEIQFILDDRLMFSFPREIAYDAATFAANAMAIGAGYPSIGWCDNPGPFAPRCSSIDIPELTRES